jgi:hypothetical protein
VAEEKREPESMVSEADWRVLVEKFGLFAKLAEER